MIRGFFFFKMDCQQILETIRQRLEKESSTPELDGQILLGQILKKPKEWILAHPGKTLTLAQEKKFLTLANRRQKGEPLAYLVGEKEFFSLPFKVNKNTLIPRPETELLVEKALEIINHTPEKKIILDIGTGSGCIIVSLAHKLKKEKNIRFLANDLSRPALALARQNSRLNRMENLIDFFADDLLGDKTVKKILELSQKEDFSEIILTANLPYISEKEYLELPKSVRAFEPQSALLSGKDGLDHYRKLLAQLKDFETYFPKKKISLLTEFGWKQKPKMEKIIKKNFPGQKTIFLKDLAGRWRAVYFSIGVL